MIKNGELGGGDERAARRNAAGDRFAQLFGAYAAAIGAPAGLAGSGRGFVCVVTSEGTCDEDGCTCLARKRRYFAAYEALRSAGQKSAKVVVRVAVWGEKPTADDLPNLDAGLEALAAHFDLTRRRRRRRGAGAQKTAEFRRRRARIC